MGIGGNIFAGVGIDTPPSPTVANSSSTYGAPSGGGRVSPLSPRHGFGMGMWGSALALAALVVIRWSLPR